MVALSRIRLFFFSLSSYILVTRVARLVIADTRVTHLPLALCGVLVFCNASCQAWSVIFQSSIHCESVGRFA